MILWRITRKKFIDKIFSGQGGLYASGRWHTIGNPIIYTAESQALAVLESLVHFNANNTPHDLVMLSINVPKVKINEVKLESLHKGWKKLNSQELQIIGNDWLSTNNSLLLKVPSVLSSSEFNYLINPRHSDLPKLEIIEQNDFSFDDRLISLSR